jgi:beta-carotene 3-hydroxylase
VSPLTAALLALGAFATMEMVSYVAHRFVMHGAGMVWHRSHHVPTEGPFERNDLFPLCFSAVGVALFALATVGPAVEPLLWVAIGVTAYGAAYLAVHEVVIHRRLPVRVPTNAYLEWLREAHRVHHRFGGEPYGMLLPLVPRALRARARADAAVSGDPLARAPGSPAARPARPRSTRLARKRL